MMDELDRFGDTGKEAEAGYEVIRRPPASEPNPFEQEELEEEQ